MKGQNYLYSGLIFLVGVLIFFVNLGTLTVDIMEARNFVTVREILESGDWLHPTMNGALRLEKPPLPTWITAVFASVFGLKSLFFLRLPAALMALWMLFSMQSIVKRLTGNHLLAMLSAISLATMLYVVLLGRRGTWDIYTHSFMLAAIVQLIALFHSRGSIICGIWGGILFGAAFLSKGPVAIYALFLPFLIAYFFYRSHFFSRKTYIALLTYVVVALLVAASWFVFIYFAFTNETGDILGKEIANWQSYNVRSWYYYLKDYPVHSGVWAVILTMGLLTPYTWRKSTEKDTYRFFWIWTIVAIVLLSLIPEKKVRYLLPTFIPAAFLVATYLEYLLVDFNRKSVGVDRIVFLLHWGMFVIVTVGLPVAVYFLFYAKGQLGNIEFGAFILGVLVCFGFLIRSLFRKGRGYFLLAIVGLLGIVISILLPHIDSIANSNFHSIAEVQERAELAELPCYATEETRIELVWLVGRKIKEVQTLEDLQPPYLLLTNKSPENYLTEQDFELVGHYDNNSKPKSHKHYQQSLEKYVSVVR